MKRKSGFLTKALVAAFCAAAFAACSKDDHKQDHNPLIDDPQTEEPQKPTVTVLDGDSFIPDDSYTVEYDGESINVGTYNVNVIMQGN